MDGYGETTISQVKVWNHPTETTITKWLFGVPGMYKQNLPSTCPGGTKCRNQKKARSKDLGRNSKPNVCFLASDILIFTPEKTTTLINWQCFVDSTQEKTQKTVNDSSSIPPPGEKTTPAAWLWHCSNFPIGWPKTKARRIGYQPQQKGRRYQAFERPSHLSHEKNPPTFYYTGWLIGILIMVCYNALYNWVV